MATPVRFNAFLQELDYYAAKYKIVLDWKKTETHWTPFTEKQTSRNYFKKQDTAQQ